YYCKQPLKVISLGGGAFMQEDIGDVCLNNAIVFYLDISWDAWKDRIHMLVDSRPVIQNKSLEEIENLFNERKPIYAQHNSKLVTDTIDADIADNYIIDPSKVS